MATFEFNGKTFYIDGKLNNQLETKILPQLEKNDKDNVFIIDGKERSGKSKFGDILGAKAASFLHSHYDLDCVGMTPEEFRNIVMKAKKRSIVIYDEAHRGMGSARTLSEINNILKDLMMEMGQKNLFVIIILPTFFLLDKYAALFRARGLFHVYERKGQRGYWVYFNERNKLKLYRGGKKEFDYNCMRWPRFRGRFMNQYAIDEKAYRAKKAASFKDKPRITRAETYKEQRDALFYILFEKLKVPYIRIANMCQDANFKIDRRSIADAVVQKKENLARVFEESAVQQEDNDEKTEKTDNIDGTYA